MFLPIPLNFHFKCLNFRSSFGKAQQIRRKKARGKLYAIWRMTWIIINQTQEFARLTKGCLGKSEQ